MYLVGDDSDGEAPDALPSGPAAVERSVDAVYARYISQKPDGKVTKEGIRQIFDRLDKEHIAKAERQKIRDCRGKIANDVSEVCSPPRVTGVAEATGLRPGWALDLIVNRDDGTPWDLFVHANQVAALQKQQDEAPELLVASPVCACLFHVAEFELQEHYRAICH